MNCTQAETVLALYIEGDLAEARTREVARHLEDCRGCRRLAEEFSRSQTMLRLHQPPDFDAAFFEQVRRNVLREIEEANERPSLISSLTGFFAPRSFALAASLAVLFAFGALAAFMLYRRSASVPPPAVTADNHSAANDRDARSQPVRPQAPASPENFKDGGAQHNPRVAASSMAAHRRRRRQPILAPTGAEAEQQATNATPQDDAPSSIPTTATQTAAEPPARVMVADNRKLTRIELQTSDPNVRIIWLSPQPSEPLSNQK